MYKQNNLSVLSPRLLGIIVKIVRIECKMFEEPDCQPELGYGEFHS